MDKLLFDGRSVTISNDGATIMQLLEIVHPAAKTLVDISMSQDNEVGDGTTSVVLYASEILHQVKGLVEDGLHPQIIARGLRRAGRLALNHVKSLSVSFRSDPSEAKSEDHSSLRDALERCAETALNSKLISGYKSLFGPMVVNAVLCLDPHLLDLSLIGVKKVNGGSVTDSFLVEDGVAFKKTFSYAGFEQQPKYFEHPKILLLHVELELKSEKDNAEVRIEDPNDYQSIVDAEWDIIYEKLDLCVQTGAQMILSRLPIGDLATQYFADRGLFCAGRVSREDMERVSKATGGKIQTTINEETVQDAETILGTCAKFEEKRVGDEKYNIITGCVGAKSATIILRGGGEQFLDETMRSMHDSVAIVKRCMRDIQEGQNGGGVVGGGGALELSVSYLLKQDALAISGRDQLIVSSLAKALEIIPFQLSDNAGIDSTDILNELRNLHASDPDANKWQGVDVMNGGLFDSFEAGVWEPTSSKLNAIQSAVEAACLILSIDETVRNAQNQQPGAPDMNGVGLGGGQPISQGMGGQGLQGLMGKGRGVRAMKGRGGK
jgi:T-complex protein 1 subunit eta